MFGISGSLHMETLAVLGLKTRVQDLCRKTGPVPPIAKGNVPQPTGEFTR